MRLRIPSSGYRSPLLSYPVVFFLMAVELVLILSTDFGGLNGGDAPSYIASATNLLQGRADLYRPPVYPAFIALCRMIFGQALEVKAMQVLQCIVAMLGAMCFIAVMRKFTFGKPRVTFWFTVFYALNPYLNLWVLFLMTETTALSGAVLLLYLMTRDLPGPISGRTGLWGGVVLLLLIFLRPVLLCWLPVCILWWWWQRRAGGAGARNALWVCAATAVLLLAYCGWVKQTYGTARLSGVSAWNKTAMLTMGGILSPEHTDNPALKEEIETVYSWSDTMMTDPLIYVQWWHIDTTANIRIEEIDAAADRAIRENPGKVARFLDARVRYLAWNEPLLWEYWFPRFKVIKTTLNLRMPVYWAFLLGVGIWLCVQWRRRLRPGGTWLCWLLCVSLMAAALLGAQNEWARLTIPTIPPAMLLIYQMASLFKVRDQDTASDSGR